MADVKALAEQLVGLTVKEVQELADVLKADYGIEPAAAAVVAVAGGDGAGAAAAEEKTAFDVILKSTDNNFSIEFEFDDDNFDGMNLQNFKATIKKQDIQTINSFVITMDDLIKNKSVLSAYFYLLSELQITHKNKYKLKQVTPSGIHGFPANNNPISIT